jgi:3-methylcrotonyl-CoA carboxylase alpha subunit
MPATVVAILKNKGDSIKTGDPLMILEAMKMEHTIHAPYDGLLTNIFFSLGAQVTEGAQLVSLQTEE